jgi:hypothetical protein
MLKCSRYRPGLAQRVGRGIAILFHDRGTGRWWVVSSTPRPHFTFWGKTRYPFYRRLGGPQARSGRGGKISSPPVFDSGTSSPVAQALYRLSYRAHRRNITLHTNLLLHNRMESVKFAKPRFFKRKIKVNVALKQATKTQKGSISITVLFLYPLR